MNSKQQRPLKKLLGIRGMGAALTAFVGLIIIYIAFGIINPAVFSGQNMLNLLRSMSKYLLIGIAQSYVLITGNIDLSIGSMVGMSAMIAATLMTTGMVPFLAIVIALIACLVVGVVNGYLVGKFKLPPFIATLGTMFVARGIAYMVNGNRNTDAIATGVGKETADAFQNCFYPKDFVSKRVRLPILLLYAADHILSHSTGNTPTTLLPQSQLILQDLPDYEIDPSLDLL